MENRFKQFSENERECIMEALIAICRSYIGFGIGAFDSKSVNDYNTTLKLLQECDEDGAYTHIYNDWKFMGEE